MIRILDHGSPRPGMTPLTRKTTKMAQNPAASTVETFRKKWAQWPHLGLGESGGDFSEILQWVLARNGWEDEDMLGKFLDPMQRILDAGCGNGRITRVLASNAPKGSHVWAWDINVTAVEQNMKNEKNVLIEEVDLSASALPQMDFDFIYCQEVLHHLENPQQAFMNLASLLREGGTIAVYVYGMKHPFREFSDEWIRSRFQAMSSAEKIEVSSALTALGESLSSISGSIQVTGLDSIGLKTGNYSVHKFLYDFFMKCFWNVGLDHSGSQAVNFDWFSPQIASKHEVGEVTSWFLESGLSISHSYEDEYGVTLHGRRET